MSSKKMDKGRRPLDPSGKILEEYPHQFGLQKPETLDDRSKRSIGLPTTSWNDGNHDFRPRSDLYVEPPSHFLNANRVGLNEIRNENTFFSSSFSEIFKNKLKLSPKNVPVGQSVEMMNRDIGKDMHFGSLEESEVHSIVDLLPDSDDLISGIFDDPEYVSQHNLGDDNFISDKTFKSIGGVVLNGQHGSLNSLYANEYPYGEHPSRTLFVRNINPNIEEGELKTLFEQYGDIHTLYTDCKCQGFVIISYYDLRAARNAMRALQNKPLSDQKLDLQFCIPKDNPSEQDTKQGTLLIFNLDSSVSHDAICQIFGVYGAIRQIRETPNNQHHTFIEFYDSRSAEAALRALNGSDIGGKKIKLEHNHPGGVKRCSMKQLSPELQLEESSGCRQGIHSNSSSICYGSTPLGALNTSGAVLVPHFANLMPASPFMEPNFPGISSREQSLCSPITVASVGSQSNPLVHGDGFHNVLYNSSTLSTMGINCRNSEGVYTRYMNKVGSSSLISEGVFGVPGNEGFPLQMHQHPNTCYHHPHGQGMWPGLPAFVNTMPVQQLRGLQGTPSQLMNAVRLQCHNLSSEIISNPLYWRLQRAFLDDSTNPPALQQRPLGRTIPYGGEHPVHDCQL